MKNAHVFRRALVYTITLALFASLLCCVSGNNRIKAATEDALIADYEENQFAIISGKEISNSVYDDINYGHITFSREKDIPGVDENISFKEAKNMLVNNKNSISFGRITDQDYAVEAAYPCAYTNAVGLRDYLENSLVPTRDQKDYGTCWAFSSISLIENYMLHNNQNNEYGNISKDTLDLSELHLAYFNFHNCPNYILPNQECDYILADDDGAFYNNGGNYYLSSMTLTKWRGAIKESTVPYNLLKEKNIEQLSNVKKAITGIDENLVYSSDVHLENAYEISLHKNPVQVKQAIKENGAVGVSFYCDGKYYDINNNSYYNNINTSFNHDVNIVGWDDNFPKENFKGDIKPANNGAWLIRNSWRDPDDNLDLLSIYGYFWISYEDTSLADHAFVFETGKSNKYDNNYFYTNIISNLKIFSSSEYCKYANVFTVNGESETPMEQIAAITIETLDPNLEYSISIHNVLENGDFGAAIGNPTTGTIVFPGIYTIPLDGQIILNRGDKFAVLVETNNKPLPFESDMDINYFHLNTGSNVGESYVYSERTDKWYDMSINGMGNFRIQALTKNIGDPIPKISNLSTVENERTQTSIKIAWDNFVGATSYNIYRSLNSEILTFVGDCTTNLFTDSNIPINSDCSYIVKPVVNGEEKVESSSKTLKTAVKPTNDDSLIYTITDSNIFKEDGYNSFPYAYGLVDDRAYDCEISFKDKNGNWIKLVPGSIQNDNNEIFWFIDINSLNLNPGIYDLKVRPFFYNSLFEKGYGKETTGIMLVPYPAPENFSVVYNEDTKEAVLTWDAVDGASKYYLDHKHDDSGLIELGITDKCSYSYVLDDTSPGSLYVFFVNAYDENLNAYSEDYYCSDYSGVTLQVPQLETTPDIFNIIKPENAVYNGSGYPANAEFKEGPVTGAAITVYYKPTEDENAAWSDVPPVDAGTYSIAIDVSGCKKYKDTEKITDENWKLVITPKELTILPDSGVIKREGDAEPIISFTYLGNVSGETPAFTGALSREAGEAIGEYLITIGDLKPEDNGNFKAKNYILKLSDTNVYMNILEKLLLGDVNADGSVDEYDVIYLKHYLAGGYNVTVSLETADIDADGYITPYDVTLLMRKLEAVSSVSA